MSDEQKKVTVTALKYHTAHGEAHEEGDTYEVDESDVANLVAQKMVADPAGPPPAPKESHPVDPMTTDDFNKPS